MRAELDMVSTDNQSNNQSWPQKSKHLTSRTETPTAFAQFGPIGPLIGSPSAFGYTKRRGPQILTAQHEILGRRPLRYEPFE